MPKPKTFSPANAEAGHFIIDQQRPSQVIVYRFGDHGKPRDWVSSLRHSSHGGFTRPGDTALNDWALKQTSYGSKMEGAAGNPFLSVATDYAQLFAHGEGWVQTILQTAPTLGEFSVPFDRVFRPQPTKLISKEETEWLFLDDVGPLSACLRQWSRNPYFQ